MMTASRDNAKVITVIVILVWLHWFFLGGGMISWSLGFPRTHYVSQEDLKLLILLPLVPGLQTYNYNHACASLMPGKHSTNWVGSPTLDFLRHRLTMQLRLALNYDSASAPKCGSYSTAQCNYGQLTLTLKSGPSESGKTSQQLSPGCSRRGPRFNSQYQHGNSHCL